MRLELNIKDIAVGNIIFSLRISKDWVWRSVDNVNSALKELILLGSEDGRVYCWNKTTDYVSQINPM